MSFNSNMSNNSLFAKKSFTEMNFAKNDVVPSGIINIKFLHYIYLMDIQELTKSRHKHLQKWSI